MLSDVKQAGGKHWQPRGKAQLLTRWKAGLVKLC